MSHSDTLGDAPHVPAHSGTHDLAKRPEELPLRAVEGLPTLVGMTLHRLLFRTISMIEQPTDTMEGPVTPNGAWFRRDRHRHPRVDPERYRLKVTGVARPRSFSLAELRELPWEERLMVMECAGNGNHWMGTAGLVAQGRWRGPSLATLLEACGGPTPETTHFAFHGLDPMRPLRPGYHYGLSLDELRKARALVAIEMNGEPLPRPRGYPARLVVPGIYSMSHVKWLGHIRGLTRPHRGFWNRHVFVNKERRGGKWQKAEARWIGLKSMITRCKRHPEGWELTGWAWGPEPVTRVEVTTDGGATWHDAEVTTPDQFFPEAPVADEDRTPAWSTFRSLWRAPAPGTHRLASRATSASGHVQPMERDPNVQGHFDITHVKWRDVTVPGA